MSGTHRVVTGLLVLVSAACNPFRGPPAVEMGEPDAMLHERWNATLISPSNLAGVVEITGSASMAPTAGAGTLISVDLANATPGGRHPWEASQGQCGSGGSQGALGSSSAYAPIEVDSDGHGHRTATLEVRTPEMGRYFVVVYASDANARTVIACGNLAAPSQ